MALPVGVLAAIYVNEFAEQRVARGIKLFFDVLNGMPSIVIGIFLYVLLVVGRGQNGFIGALSLAIIMLPLISRSTQEVLALVPDHLREGSIALGVSKWRTILGRDHPDDVQRDPHRRDAGRRPRGRRDRAAALHVRALRRLGVGERRASRWPRSR